MTFKIKDFTFEGDSIEATAAWINTELDYTLCGHFGICMDELDLIPLDKVRELRIYGLFEDQEALNNQAELVHALIDQERLAIKRAITSYLPR